jgi:hypothetical protein
MNNKTPSDNSLRRKARGQGYRLIKIRENSRLYAQYGPFLISDATTNCAVQCAMTAHEVNAWLTSDDESPAVASGAEAV